MSGVLSSASTSEKLPLKTWLIALVVALSTFMEVLDTTIANVALRYIAGTEAVSQDEAGWVVTTYLVANAIALTASASLPKYFGRKRYYIFSIGLFTLSSVLCGFAWNLQTLLFFRILQGLGGGGMVPISSSILAQSFPPDKRGQAFAIFGVAVVVAPVVGPTLGGWLADNYSWAWCFFINGPVGIAAILAIIWLLPQDDERSASSFLKTFDLVGFLMVATFLGSLEMVLDRGQEDDWFSSSFIVATSLLSAAALAALIPWTRNRINPILDLSMLSSRQFLTCFMIMGMTGAILIATTQFLPQLLQSVFGYTATWAGWVLSPGGVVTMAMFAIAGRLSSHIQPRWLIALGALATASAMFDLSRLTADVGFGFFAWSRVMIGIGLPLIFVPINLASYDGIPTSQTDHASALMNIARNVGGSIGVAAAQNVLVNREQFHQVRLSEQIYPTSHPYQDLTAKFLNMLHSSGLDTTSSHGVVLEWMGHQVAIQAQLMAYIDVYWMLMLMSACAVPLALLLHKVSLNSHSSAVH